MEQVAHCFRVFVRHFDASNKVARIAFHVQSILAVVRVFVSRRKIVLQGAVVSSLWVHNKAARFFFGKSDLPCERYRSLQYTDLPPITFAYPLNTFVKLLTTTSAYGITSTLTKFPIVSSTIIRNSYLSARSRNRWRFGERKRGLLGNSVIRHLIGGQPGFFLDSVSSKTSSASISSSWPNPKK